MYIYWYKRYFEISVFEMSGIKSRELTSCGPLALDNAEVKTLLVF